MKINIQTTLIALFFLLASLWGYGYFLASEDLKEGLSIVEAGFTHKVLNPLSALGYKYHLNNSKRWQNHLKYVECKKFQQDIHEGLYTYEHFGIKAYEYKDKAINDAIRKNCSKYMYNNLLLNKMRKINE